MFNYEEHEKKIEWYREARFGMFIHWGLYAIPARGEWVRSIEKMPESQYMQYFREFSAKDYDPKAWAKAAKQAGMKYAVMTAKHHDGFCLFDSKLTDYKSTNTPFGRDAIREYLDAFRAEGLKVGLYYSLLDWHHPDYPHYQDWHHPERENPAESNENRDFSRYLDYMHGQIEELLTNYGKIDILWFDFSYDKLKGEAWQPEKILAMLKKYQPWALIDNRMEVGGEGFGSLVTENPSDYCGDFLCPEQVIPPYGLKDYKGRDVMWEANFTMNNNWGYHAADHHFKPSEMLIRKLVECVSKNGNMLLNVGPDARGRIPAESLKILKEIGDWMADNSESIYGCGASSLPKPDFGRITQKGDTLYYHVFDAPVGYVPVSKNEGETVTARLLSTGAELDAGPKWNTGGYPEYAFISLGPDPKLPTPADTVIAVRKS